jgi:hypothetical protein
MTANFPPPRMAQCFRFTGPGLSSKAGSAHFPTHVAVGCSNGQTVVWSF